MSDGDNTAVSMHNSAQSHLTCLFKQALQSHLSNDLDTAKRLYNQYLSTPNHLTTVLCNLGSLYIDTNRQLAQTYLEASLLLAPEYPETLTNLARLYELQGDITSAKDLYLKALKRNPTLYPALTNLVGIHNRSGNYSSSLDLLDAALNTAPYEITLISLKAKTFLLYSNSTSACEYLDSVESHIQSVDLPQFYSSYADLLLCDSYQDFNHALSLYTKALTLDASLPVNIYINKGEAYRRLSMYQECLSWCDSSLERFPSDPGLINLKALTLSETGCIDEALQLYSEGLRTSPTHLGLFINFAYCQMNKGLYSQAISSFESILGLDSTNPQAHRGLGQSYFSLSKQRTSLYHYQQAVLNDKRNPILWSNLLYTLSFNNLYSPSMLRQLYDLYQRDYLLPVISSSPPFESVYSPLNSRRFKLGIVSAEIGSHCVSFFLLTLVKHLSPLGVDLYIFPTKNRAQDPRWQEFKDLADHFQPIDNLSDEQAATLIRSFRLDVLLETSQHMSFNRLPLLARRLAPVQAHYIGMHGSTGATNIDYFIGDACITPTEFSDSFTESFITLPRTWVAFTPPNIEPPIVTTNDPGIPVRLGCFNNIAKVSRSTVRLWAQVLLSVQNSTISIKDSHRESDLSYQKSIVSYLVKLGVDSSRIHVLQRCHDWYDHMQCYNSIDIALDTTPLASGTTAFDALYMGCCFVAHSSDWIGGRLSASILQGLDRSEWIASSTSEYVDKVSRLSSAIELHRRNRHQYRRDFLASSLCDGADLASSLVNELRSAYDQAFFNNDHH